MSKTELAYLLKKLNIDINKVKSDNEEGMEERIRLQKIVYFAKILGAHFNYNHSLYLHGPYSQRLARDYYSLSQEDIIKSPTSRDIDNILPRIEEIYQKDTIWLETAATLINVKINNRRLSWNQIKDHVYDIKHDILFRGNKNRKYVDTVFEDLKQLNLISN